jgi:hypothetical protein
MFLSSELPRSPSSFVKIVFGWRVGLQASVSGVLLNIELANVADRGHFATTAPKKKLLFLRNAGKSVKWQRPAV